MILLAKSFLARPHPTDDEIHGPSPQPLPVYGLREMIEAVRAASLGATRPPEKKLV
jgi:hypothetical protein